MDQEMIAYFDEHFRKALQHTESLHEQTTQQIDSLRQKTEEQGEQITGLRQEVTEQIRHTQILVEDMHRKVQLIAEGYFGIVERMKTFQDQMAEDFKHIHNSPDLHCRGFENRIRIVEERTERKGRDPWTSCVRCTARTAPDDPTVSRKLQARRPRIS